MSSSATESLATPPSEQGGGNGLLWLLAAVAVLFAFLRPRAPMDWLKLVDWQTMGALAGLLAITQGVEKSGMLQAAAQRLLARTHSQRSLALLLTASARRRGCTGAASASGLSAMGVRGTSSQTAAKSQNSITATVGSIIPMKATKLSPERCHR